MRRREHRWRRYSFSWSTDITIAGAFAHKRYETGLDCALLSTVAPPSAILLKLESSPGYYDEGEVIVDPFALGKVEVVERHTGRR